MSQHVVTLLLGSNLGNPEENIEAALRHIREEIGEIKKVSEIMKTAPVEFVTSNFFCNIAVLIKTQFSPVKLLESVKNIEKKMGRNKDTFSTKEYLDRIIDIDVVTYGNVKFWSSRLEIPHKKHLYQRDFSKRLLSQLWE